MIEKEQFRKKFLFPIAYLTMVGFGVWGATGLIPNGTAGTPSAYSSVEPAAGSAEEMQVAQIKMGDQVPAIEEKEIIDAPPIADLKAAEQEMPPLRISPDKPEIVSLSREATNVMVGSDEHLRAVPDTNRTIILIPKKPGATYFKALDANGNVIMQRHVIIGGAKSEYIRIRRACSNGQESCKQYSLYYCPDACHEVDVMQDAKQLGADHPAPEETSNVPPGSPNDEPVTE